MVERSVHSIKVPRLFKTASKIVKIVKEGGGSVKEQVYSGKHPNIKALYALVVETLQHEKQLTKIFEHSKLLLQEPKLDPWLARVLMTELLWGKKRLSGESKPVKTILSYQSSFIIDDDVKDAKDPTQKKDTVEVKLPRYARVNTLYMTVEEAVTYFRDEGWILAKKGDKDLFPSSDHFRCDEHIPEVLTFPPGTQLYQHPLYRDGSILLQDKASCLASHLLSPPPGSVVLDMCAAPGMKTTHLAAIMKNKGTIYAVEKDPKRYKTLCNFVEQAGATCVRTLEEDSVQLQAESVPNVEYILVDPSCSGSGMVNRVEVGRDDSGSIEAQDIRLRKLVGFQKRILYHALSCFPTAHRVLYSTCSVMTAENEEVVSFALNKQFAENFSWKLVNLFPDWPSRGCEDEFPRIGNNCVYSRTNEDLTNGFFMAMFERDDVSSAQQEILLRDNMLKTSKEKCAKEEENESKRVKRKKRKQGEEERGLDEGEDLNGGEGENGVIGGECEEGKKKHRKKKSKEGEEMESNVECLEEGEGSREDGGESAEGENKIKKKRKKDDKEGLNGECLEEGKGEREESGMITEVENKISKKKDKKRKKGDTEDLNREHLEESEEVCLERVEVDEEEVGDSEVIAEGENKIKKKKKKRKKNEKDVNEEYLEESEEVRLERDEGDREEVGDSEVIAEGENKIKKKRKKRKKDEKDLNEGHFEESEEACLERDEGKTNDGAKKKKNKKKSSKRIEEVIDEDDACVGQKHKKRKKSE